MKNYQIQIIIEATLSFLGSSGISLFSNWFAVYDLLKPTIFIQNVLHLYINLACLSRCLFVCLFVFLSVCIQ